MHDRYYKRTVETEAELLADFKSKGSARLREMENLFRMCEAAIALGSAARPVGWKKRLWLWKEAFMMRARSFDYESPTGYITGFTMSDGKFYFTSIRRRS